MENKRRLEKFFALENARDWAAYQVYLHPLVEWRLFDDNGGEACFRGVEEYMRKIQAAYAGSAAAFHCLALYAASDGQRIAAVLQNTLGEISIDIFEFSDGLIIREYEFPMKA